MRKRLIVAGKVQGVWYRDWFTGEARALGLAGWVRNRADGTVEALLDGPDATVTAMIERAWQGSPAARVSTVDVQESHDDEAFAGFARR
jgi:acylphosphatase